MEERIRNQLTLVELKQLFNDGNVIGDKERLFGDAKEITGDVSGITGDVSEIRGNVSEIIKILKQA